MSDITWRDVYDGPEELADCLSKGAQECEKRGQYELSSHATVAATVLYELSEESAVLREKLASLEAAFAEETHA
jgi:hypothetical protein